ncbi:MAG: hypothetical protein NZV14_04395 [Bryobacteraceae bacterium]|nr:hypothetical protein [Bryobacteraceae bacterium]MDW8377373.1 hypothetical protein [Bryobacterales bacterium]
MLIPKIYNGRNRTFFFWTTEMAAGSPGNALIQQTAPLDPWRTGDFSNLRNNEASPLIIVRDPTTEQPFPGNVIPRARLNPVSLRFQELFYARVFRLDGGIHDDCTGGIRYFPDNRRKGRLCKRGLSSSCPKDKSETRDGHPPCEGKVVEV